MKTTTLSLRGTTGTVARNRDNTHEDAVINLTGENGVTGQLSVRLPVARDKDTNEVNDEDTGLNAGEYSVSISLSRKAEDLKTTAATTSTTSPTVARRAADRDVGAGG